MAKRIGRALLMRRIAARQRGEIGDWERQGRPAPPPHAVKQRAVRESARATGIRVLVETGTHAGTMVFAMLDEFERIYSIELSTDYFERARALFADYPHVTILHGDSGEVLPRVLAELTERAVFWLDGHYSADNTARGEKETPIERELDAVLRHPVGGHVVLIDDAREFDGHGDWPPLASVRESVAATKPGVAFAVRDDIIRIGASSA